MRPLWLNAKRWLSSRVLATPPFLDHPQRFCTAVKEFLTDCQCGASQAASR